MEVKRKYIAKKLFRSMVYFMGLFFFGLMLWTNRFFGRVTIDQALSTIDFSMEGVFAADSLFFRRFIEWCLFWPAVIVGIFMGFGILKNSIFYSTLKPISKLLLLKFAKFSKKNIIPYLHFIFFVSGLLGVAYQYNIFEFFKNLNHSETDYFQSSYVDTNNILFHTQHPKSLVIIYIESLETTYSNKKLFGHDLLRKLKMFNNSISFENFRQMPGADWTIAGIVSTQCAVPLKLMTILDGNRMGENSSHYLSGAKCLSDILAEHGYKNIFMNGASLEFAGKGRFVKNHHYTEAYGREEWLAKGIKESEMNDWGLPDDLLFAQAKIKLDELIKSNQLFNLTLLTVDTHGLAGELSKTCQKQGYHDFEDIVECTANQTAAFVNYIQSKGWLDKLNIVILGDHLAKQNYVSAKLNTIKTRFIFNLIISDQPLVKNTENIVHFDMLPTVLNSIGFHFAGGRLGLGYSAILHPRAPELANRITIMEEEVKRNSQIYNRLWLQRRDTMNLIL